MQLRAITVVAVMAACGGSSGPMDGVANSSTANSPPVLTAPDRRNPLVAKWAAQLDDERTADRAVAELESLGNPDAIVPLGEFWQRTRHVYAMRVLISLARPLTPEEARTTFFVDYEKTGRPASWDRLLPYLRTAIATIDVENPRSIDSATRAAGAIEEARLAGALAELTELASQPPLKKWIAAQIAAIRAIGAIGGADATRTLLGLIAQTPPPHPRMPQPDRELQRNAEERFALHLMITGAAINALPPLKSGDDIEILIKQMFVTPELNVQFRRVLVANGPLALDPLRTVVRGEHKGVNDFMLEHKLDRYCGGANDLPPAQCVPVSAREFYPSMILGDLRDTQSVPDLIVAAKRRPYPPYYIGGQPGPPSPHTAIYDAFRKIGSTAPLAHLQDTWRDPKVEAGQRALAVGAYGVLATDATDVDELGKIAADNAADDTLRQEAATAYARLAHDPKHIALLMSLAKRYVDAAAKKRATADKLKPTTDRADATYKKAEETMLAAKQKLVAVANDSTTSAQQLMNATAATKKAEEVYKEAKKKHRAQVAPYRAADQAAKAYLGYARMFQSHVARVEIAIRCKSELPCFAAVLKEPSESVVVAIKPHLDASTWDSRDKEGLLDAAIDRALLEIGKRGKAATQLTDSLIDRLMKGNLPSRALVEGILLALPKIAPRPCASCVTKLDPESKRFEEPLQTETKLVRSYFTWAK